MIISRNRQLSVAGSTNHNVPRQLLEPRSANLGPAYDEHANDDQLGGTTVNHRRGPPDQPPSTSQSTVGANGGQPLPQAPSGTCGKHVAADKLLTWRRGDNTLLLSFELMTSRVKS
ncbi:hypothetical protein Tco_0760851 [Tanacetum coccineum]